MLEYARRRDKVWRKIIKWFLPYTNQADRIEALEEKAGKLEKKADEIEREAALRKRIKSAEKRIETAQPKGILASNSKLLILVGIVIIVIFIAKGCGNG